MNQDSKRWDIIHRKTHKDTDKHSAYAVEKEVLFPRGSVVCDLGGGTGVDTLYFLQKGHQVILFDISAFALEVAERKVKQAGLETKLVTRQVDFGLHQIPLNPKSVNVVYSRISLHYFPASEFTAMLSTIYMSLVPGGMAFISVKSNEDEAEMEYLREAAPEYEPGVFIENGQLRARFSISQLEDILRNAGIPQFEVKPYNEQLAHNVHGLPQILLLNEITFYKK